MWMRLSQGVRDGLIVAAVLGVVAILWAFVPGKSTPERFAWILSCVTIRWEAMCAWLVAEVAWARWVVISVLLAFLAALVCVYRFAKRPASKRALVDELSHEPPLEMTKTHQPTSKEPTGPVNDADRERDVLSTQILGVFWASKAGQRASSASIALTLGRNENLVHHQLELLVAEGLVTEDNDPLSGRSFSLSPDGRAYCATLSLPELEAWKEPCRKNPTLPRQDIRALDWQILSALYSSAEGSAPLQSVVKTHHLTPVQARKLMINLRDKGLVKVWSTEQGHPTRYTLTEDCSGLLIPDTDLGENPRR